MSEDDGRHGAQGGLLLQKLTEERRRTSELSRELGAAYEAARLMQGGDRGPPGAPVWAATRSRSPRAKSCERRTDRGSEIRVDRTTTDLRGSSELRASNDFEREIGELTQWKETAMQTLLQQQRAIGSLKEQWKQQAQYSMILQDKVKEFGGVAAEREPRSDFRAVPSALPAEDVPAVPDWLIRATETDGTAIPGGDTLPAYDTPEEPEPRAPSAFLGRDACSELSVSSSANDWPHPSLRRSERTSSAERQRKKKAPVKTQEPRPRASSAARKRK